MLEKFGTSKPGPSRPAPTYEVKRSDLPLHCPPDAAPLWSLHPRVYLPIDRSGHEKCPYCGAEYVLKD